MFTFAPLVSLNSTHSITNFATSFSATHSLISTGSNIPVSRSTFTYFSPIPSSILFSCFYKSDRPRCPGLIYFRAVGPQRPRRSQRAVNQLSSINYQLSPDHQLSTARQPRTHQETTKMLPNATMNP